MEYTNKNKTKKRKKEVQHIKPLIHSIAKTEAFTVSLWESSYTSLHLRCPQDAVNSLRFVFWVFFFFQVLSLKNRTEPKLSFRAVETFKPRHAGKPQAWNQAGYPSTHPCYLCTTNWGVLLPRSSFSCREYFAGATWLHQGLATRATTPGSADF